FCENLHAPPGMGRKQWSSRHASDRRGFGSTLLERVLAGQLGGTVNVSYPPEGARARIQQRTSLMMRGSIGCQSLYGSAELKKCLTTQRRAERSPIEDVAAADQILDFVAHGHDECPVFSRRFGCGASAPGHHLWASGRQ
ncbi:MAG: hypothetical protein ACK4N1_14820, partial [Pseudorhizobium sp.]